MGGFLFLFFIKKKKKGSKKGREEESMGCRGGNKRFSYLLVRPI
jgi:hypothetical protein